MAVEEGFALALITGLESVWRGNLKGFASFGSGLKAKVHGLTTGSVSRGYSSSAVSCKGRSAAIASILGVEISARPFHRGFALSVHAGLLLDRSSGTSIGLRKACC